MSLKRDKLKKKKKKKGRKNKYNEFNEFLDLFHVIFMEYLSIYSLSNLCYIHIKSRNIVNNKMIFNNELMQIYPSMIKKIAFRFWLRSGHGSFDGDKTKFIEQSIANDKQRSIIKLILDQIPKKITSKFVKSKLKIPTSLSANIGTVYKGNAFEKGKVSGPCCTVLHQSTNIKSIRSLILFIMERLCLYTHEDDDVSMDELCRLICLEMDNISLQHLKHFKPKSIHRNIHKNVVYAKLFAFLIYPYLFAKNGKDFSIYSNTFTLETPDNGYDEVGKVETWITFILCPKQKKKEKLNALMIKMYFRENESDGA